MQRWDRIEAFVEVVRIGSFSGAARHLGVSSSHVSRLISQLEAQLDTQLLYRTTRQTRLTDAGQVYYEHCH
ncbi:LysR family transcriptional regulator, partial [Cobetia marina]